MQHTRWLAMAAETLLAVLVAVGLLASGSVLPVLGVFLSLLSPLPFVLLRLRHGFHALTLALGLTALTLAGLASTVQGVAFLLEFGLPAVVLAEGLRRGGRPELLVTAVATLLTLGGVGVLVLTSEEWAHPLTAVRRYVEALLSDMETLTGRLGLPGDGPFPLSGSSATLRSFLLMTFPGLFFAGSLLTTSGHLFLVRLLALRWSSALPGMAAGPFRWQLPESLVWVFIAGSILYLAGPWWLQALGLNVLIVLVSLYFLQGMSIAAFLFQRFHLPRALGALSVLLLLLQPLLALLVAGLGLFDVWFAFRQLSLPRPPRQG